MEEGDYSDAGGGGAAAVAVEREKTAASMGSVRVVFGSQSQLGRLERLLLTVQLETRDIIS